MKIHELKTLLQEFLEDLEKYDDSTEVKVYGNTYFVPAGFGFISIPSVGFVSFVEPVDEEDEEEIY